jgi:hypothetical protein
MLISTRQSVPVSSFGAKRLVSACAVALFAFAGDIEAAPLVTVTATDCHVATMRVFAGGYLLSSPAFAAEQMTIDGEPQYTAADSILELQCAEGPLTIHSANYAPFFLAQLHTAIHLDRPLRSVTYVERPYEIDCNGSADADRVDDCGDILAYHGLPVSGTWNTMVGFGL